MIEEVKLRNWKTHADSEFEFAKGTNVLIGPMGSGKSSVMDGICFALFGTFPGLQARRLSLEEVIMSKPAQQDDASVELGFSYGGKQYRIERKLKRKGSTEAKIFCNGTLLAGPKPRDVNAAVEKAVEINYNLFSRAVYSEQNEIDFFLRMAPGERKAKFDELLDLQRYETVRANAVSAANRLKALARDKKAILQEQRTTFSEKEEKGLAKRVSEKQHDIKLLEKSVSSRAGKAAEAEKAVKRLEAKESEFKQLQKSVSENRAVAAELKKAVEQTRLETKGKSLSAIEAGLAEKRKQVKGLEENLGETEKLGEQEAKRKSQLEKETALAEKRKQELEKHFKELQSLGPACPVCKQKLEKHTSEQLLKENRTEAEKIENALKVSLAEDERLAERIDEIKKGSLDIAGKRDRSREEAIRLEEMLARAKKLAEKEKQLKSVLAEADANDAKLRALKFDENELLSKRKHAIEEKAAIESEKKGIQANEALIKEMNAGLERIEKAKKQVELLQESIAAIEGSADKASYFINSLLAAQTELRETLVTTINEAMHGIWQAIYPYRDFVSAKMDSSSNTYELMVKERAGNWVRVEGILSGGERSAAAICIRIAFSLVLARSLSWLILDEPTHNLDSSAVETLARMMQGHLPSLVEQVFVITHDREMKKAASGSLYVLQREKDTDSVTRPVSMPLEN